MSSVWDTTTCMTRTVWLAWRYGMNGVKMALFSEISLWGEYRNHSKRVKIAVRNQ